ncbi:DUF5703 domain-containing protein [Pedobacter sp. UYP30]|uniref:DUF5703 domain-containing protein n=1 Tax=Pedobacter sp. UYP30 TaxID=1756400 RepID=UPI003396C01B
MSLSLGVFAQPNLKGYNIKWTSQSKNALESMPVGGNDIGCNVWVEDNSIYFYVGRSNSFDENNALLKTGRIKVTFSPNPFKKFSQELKLKEGYVEIIGTDGALKVTSRLWVEPNAPEIHLDVVSNSNISVKAEYQNWRIEKKPVSSRWVVPSYIDYPGKDVYWFPDSVKSAGANIVFYHQNNSNNLVIDKEIVQQGLSSLKDSLWNPLKDFIFGGVLSGKNMVVSNKDTGTYLNTHYKSIALRSKTAGRSFQINVALRSGYSTDNKVWEKQLTRNVNSGRRLLKNKFAAHQLWWKNFWGKSWIMLNTTQNNPANSVWQVGRNYNIFRYQMACNSNGEYPTKFNGGLFTVDPVLVDTAFKKDNPDFRAWGGGVMTAQNQRLLYWPLLKTGDFNIMPQQFDFYRRACKNAELRTKFYWGHKGAYFTDQMNQAGIISGREYGWVRPNTLDIGTQNTPYHEYYFTSQLEFSFMMLEYYRFSNIDIQPYLHFIKSAIQFFDQHYRMLSVQNFGSEFTPDGKYNLYPCMALETYTGHVKNPADVIAALTVLTTRMQKLPLKYVSKEEKKFYALMLSRLPKMPLRMMRGVETIAPAEQWDRIINQEIPQLYPVFPWGLFGVGKPNLQLAINTWKFGVDNENQKNYIGWHQDAIFCARMGLTDEAKHITLKKLSNSQRRFPTFWGPGYDWVPDHNWGGSGMIGLQEMLMQTVDDKIYLLPAWPKEWDVNFKLHAPKNTTVELTYQNGKVKTLKVTPSSRQKDIIWPDSFK